MAGVVLAVDQGPACRCGEHVSACRDFAAELAELRTRVAALERERTSGGTAADARLVRVLAEVLDGEAVTATAMVERALANARLQAALDGCSLEGAGELGTWLKLRRDADVGGFTLKRSLRRTAAGYAWRVCISVDAPTS